MHASILVPPDASSYDPVLEKVVQDRNVVYYETDEDMLAGILKQIADSVQDGIVMEEDHPGRHADKKMPILDMKVWLNEDGILLHQHYEKEMSSKLILDASSTQSSSCKRNVHRQEIIRRMLNCSPMLDWKEQVAPILTEYMARMRLAGYNEGYRKQVLKHAITAITS